MTRFTTCICRATVSVSLYALASGMTILGMDALLASFHSNSESVIISSDSELIIAMTETNSETPKTMRDRGSGR